MIPALDMSKVHPERNSLGRDEQPTPRQTTATLTATNNNAAYTSIGSTTTPGRALPLRNQPTGASTQLQQSALPSSSSVTPQTSPRGQIYSARLVQRALEVESYLNMNPLSCTDVRTLQRSLIATAEAALRMKRQYEEESRMRMEVYEQRLSAVTMLLTQSPPMSLAGSPSHKPNHNNASGNATAVSASLNTSMDKGVSASTRSGRRYPVTSISAASSPNRGGQSSASKPSAAVGSSSSSSPPNNTTTQSAMLNNNNNSGGYSGASTFMTLDRPSTGSGSARRPSRQENAVRVGASAGTRAGDPPSLLTTVASGASSGDHAHGAVSARPRLDAASYQDSPVRTREVGRRGSMTSSHAGGISGMSYQDLGEGLGFASRANTADRASPTAHVQRSLTGGRAAMVSSGRQEPVSVNSSRNKGTGSHSARATAKGV